MGRRNRFGATLSEVMIGLALFAMFSLAMLGLLIQSARLDSQEEINTQLTALAQRIVEEQIDKARHYEGYQSLADVALTPTSDPKFLYTQTVTDVAGGLKKVSVSLFYSKRDKPTVVDISRPRKGEAVSMAVIVGEPNP